jgi:GGDEF domain-containing protein
LLHQGANNDPLGHDLGDSFISETVRKLQENQLKEISKCYDKSEVYEVYQGLC